MLLPFPPRNIYSLLRTCFAYCSRPSNSLEIGIYEEYCLCEGLASAEMQLALCLTHLEQFIGGYDSASVAVCDLCVDVPFLFVCLFVCGSSTLRFASYAELSVHGVFTLFFIDSICFLAICHHFEGTSEKSC